MTELMCKLDWFAFTFPIAQLGDADEIWTLSHILTMFKHHTNATLEKAIGGHLWTFGESSGFYTHSITHPVLSCRINWRAGNPYAQAVFSGQACDVVLLSLSLDEFLSLSNGRCTRLDIAVDIETSLTPADFIASGYSARILSHSSMATPTGLTEYVGSRQGERMARIYRYHPPHPRSHLLRIEVELKGDAAKMACASAARSEFRNLVFSANLPFEWKHPIWEPGELILSKIPARAYDRDGAETLKWLNDVVAPSLKKADQNGLIILSEWLTKHFPLLFGK